MKSKAFACLGFTTVMLVWVLFKHHQWDEEDEARQARATLSAPAAPSSASSTSASVPLRKPFFVRSVRAAAFEASVSKFAAQERLSEEERAGFLSALYDAQQNLATTEWDNDDPDNNDIRTDVYVEFLGDLLRVFGPDRLLDIISRWNVHAMLLEAEQAQALALEN